MLSITLLLERPAHPPRQCIHARVETNEQLPESDREMKLLIRGKSFTPAAPICMEEEGVWTGACLRA
jgi:hypothetical protein